MRPLLLLDVDGVLMPVGGSVPRGFVRHETDRYDVVISEVHGVWLRSLTPLFELMWVTTWGASASEVLGTLLDLPDMDAVALGDMPREGTRKLAAVSVFVGDRPFAWVDDELYDDAFEWAATREASTLLVRTSPMVGLQRGRRQGSAGSSANDWPRSQPDRCRCSGPRHSCRSAAQGRAGCVHAGNDLGRGHGTARPEDFYAAFFDRSRGVVSDYGGRNLDALADDLSRSGRAAGRRVAGLGRVTRSTRRLVRPGARQHSPTTEIIRSVEVQLR